MDRTIDQAKKGLFEAVSVKHVFSLLLVSVIGLSIRLWGDQVRTFAKLLRRDLIILHRFIGLKVALWSIRRDTTLCELFRRTVARKPDDTFIFNRDARWSFQRAEDYSNQIANCFSQMGLSSGDTVALLLENTPEYILLWLGLSKIGVISALINTNLRTKALGHSIEVTSSKAIIFSASTADNLESAIDAIRQKKPDIRLFVFGAYGNSGTARLHATQIRNEIESASAERPSYKGSSSDKLMYIFTSGTTGLPKAAIIRQSRYIQLGYSSKHIFQTRPNDTIYLYMPFYHAAAAILGTSLCLIQGVRGAVAVKFSASNFWNDCVDLEVTLLQYIGEICRYLLAQPVKQVEKQHKVRLAFGNGLQKHLWLEFQHRFNVRNIIEFYGSTEGTTSLANIDNTVGAIGFLPLASKLAGQILPLNIIKVDPGTGTPIRTSDGLCKTCEPGEVGEIVAVIRNNDPLRRFDGYVDQEATAKKIYRDVFTKGDRVFSSKDLVYKDNCGYIYFKDRLGDTYRWKGENVSTTEVELVFNSVISNSSVACCAYGVEVPGAEGRAGMITLIDPEKQVNLESLLQGLKSNLPSYAVPLFLRITNLEDVTGTYKMSKVKFQTQGFDLTRCAPDPVFLLDVKASRYIPLTEETLDLIKANKLRL